MLSRVNESDLCGFFKTEWQPDLDHSSVKKSPHKSNSFRCEGISKFGKFTKILNKDKQVKKLLFLGILLTFSVFIIFMIFQLILPVLLTPTNYCFQDQVTSPSDRLLVVNQTFTKLDMMYTEFVVWPPDMVSVLILDSRKYGGNQIYLYHCDLTSPLFTEDNLIACKMLLFCACSPEELCDNHQT